MLLNPRYGILWMFFLPRNAIVQIPSMLAAPLFDVFTVLSFVFLRGRCRTCHKKISWQYPVVELTCALTFGLLALNYQSPVSNVQFWIQLVFASFLIVIAMFDLKHYLILDKVVWPGIILAAISGIWGGHFVPSLLAGAGLALFFLLQYLLSQGRWIGLGDVKLGLFLGLVFGWPLTLTCIALAYFSGAAVGVLLIGLKRKQLSSQLPFGAFLGFSGIIVLIWGPAITGWYAKLIGL